MSGGGVRWTQEQYNAYVNESNAKAVPLPDINQVIAPKRKSGPNQTEAEYLMLLNEQVRLGTLKRIFPHESIKFKIGEDVCWYMPDFVCLNSEGVIECHEVKAQRGKWTSARDDAKVKFKAAKMNYNDFLWFWCVKNTDTGAWDVS